jgi:hypothetical protein
MFESLGFNDMACPSFGRIAYNLVLHNDVLFFASTVFSSDVRDMTQHTFTEERSASALLKNWLK